MAYPEYKLSLRLVSIMLEEDKDLDMFVLTTLETCFYTGQLQHAIKIAPRVWATSVGFVSCTRQSS